MYTISYYIWGMSQLPEPIHGRRASRNLTGEEQEKATSKQNGFFSGTGDATSAEICFILRRYPSRQEGREGGSIPGQTVLAGLSKPVTICDRISLGSSM